MPNLIAITFPEAATAFELRADLVRLQSEYLVALDDAVVVTRADDGAVKLHQAVNLTATGAASGSLWGLLIGGLLLSPVFGALVGAGVGAISGKLSDIGIDDAFMKNLAESFQPGTSAVFLLVRAATPDKLIAHLEAYRGKGQLLQTSLTSADEAELRNLLETKGVA